MSLCFFHLISFLAKEAENSFLFYRGKETLDTATADDFQELKDYAKSLSSEHPMGHRDFRKIEISSC